MSATTHDGKTIRMLTMIDEYMLECLTIRVARRLGSYEVLESLANEMTFRGTLELFLLAEGSADRDREVIDSRGNYGYDVSEMSIVAH